MITEPFPELSHRPTVVHVRTQAFSDRAAPFIRQTVLGLRPYFDNVVLATSVDCDNPPDVAVEIVRVSDLRNPLSCLQIAAYLRERYPSIGVVMGHMGNGVRAGKLLAETLGVPLLGQFGGSDVNVEIHKEAHRHVYDEIFAMPSAHFVTVAGYLRDKLIQYGAPSDRLFTWHRGVALDHFEHVDRPPASRVRLVVSGRILEVKGHEYLIRAVARLREEGRRTKLVVIGDGPLEDQMKALAAELGVADDVRFVGRVAHREVVRYLTAADVYVHPSVTCDEGRTEGVPNAIMEAHATGLPVVATDHGGIAEVVLDGESGFLVPERNVELLAHRIGMLVDSRELRIRMGLRGRAHVEREFDLAAQSRRLAARLHHTMLAGDLFDARGWPKHRARVQARAAATGSIVFDPASFLANQTHPHFVYKRPVIGPIVVGYKRAIWSAIFRPYLRLLGREISRFIGNEISNQLTDMNLAQLRNARRLPVVSSSTQLLKSAVACLDCPHCPVGAPWPDEPCPLDAGCLETLQREFAAIAPSPVPEPVTTPETLSLTDATIPASGRLEHADGAFRAVHVFGSLQKVADVAALFRELRRVLAAHGMLHLQIWPLPNGRDGARLLGDIAIPFAALLFSRETLAAHSGAVLRSPRVFDAADLQRWLTESGFAVDHVAHPPEHDDPCEMHVQARFAAVLRRSGLTREQLARSFVATCNAAAVALAAPRPASVQGSR